MSKLDDLYVVLEHEDGFVHFCYMYHEPFIGTVARAKLFKEKLEESFPDSNYVIYKLQEVVDDN